MLNKTDEQLMLLITQGNKQAFGILTKRYLSQSVFYCDNLVGNSADDIVQESFITVWQKAYSFKPEKAIFKTWFYTILKNNCYNYLKKYNKLNHKDINELHDFLTDGKHSAETSLILKENNQELQQTINKLNQREQQVIKLRYFEELSNKQTAQIMNSSVKAIETLLNRAKNKLRKTLK